MSLPKFLIYHRDDDKFILFDNGDIIDVFEHFRSEETWGKISLYKKNIYFQYENHSFAKINDDDKIIRQDKKLEIVTKNRGNIKIDDKNYDFHKKYLRINLKKTIRIPQSSNKKCYDMYHIGNHLLCIIDWEEGYCETPDTFLVIMDLISHKIMDKIDLQYFNGDSFSCIKHDDKLYMVSTEFDQHSCPAKNRNEISNFLGGCEKNNNNIIIFFNVLPVIIAFCLFLMVLLMKKNIYTLIKIKKYVKQNLSKMYSKKMTAHFLHLLPKNLFVFAMIMSWLFMIF
jgi:hypothetical protein